MKAIVTGHTRGLGEAIARDLMWRGIPVLGIARGQADALQAAFPDLLTQAALDLGRPDALRDWLLTDDLRDFLDGCSLALLVNNAGTVQPVGPPQDQDPADVALAVGLNVTAPLMLSAALARLQQAAACRILHISSGAGRNAYQGWSVYCATKAALDHHARTVALDGHAGLRISSLAPGIVDTDMQAEIRATPEERFPLRSRFVELKQAGELVAPSECATHVVNYLLGPSFGAHAVDDLRD
ncbi:SDR family oxidoreductase [Pseudoduganella sp. GCM10020061]|uniref:SDR family oxidoreductase n=1 Tax=Pseudoduganella sp. GCM10020061 TaxID=3317345 RepID=UPI00363F044D